MSKTFPFEEKLFVYLRLNGINLTYSDNRSLSVFLGLCYFSFILGRKQILYLSSTIIIYFIIKIMLIALKK